MPIYLKLYLKVISLSYIKLFYLMLSIITFSSLLLHKIEPERFPKIFDAVWYVLVTITTVGYGDYTPVTIIGRSIGIFLFIFGIGSFTIFISKVFEAFANIKKNKEEGKMSFRGENHIVIIGWSEKVKITIREILSTNDVHIVLIDENLDTSPIKNNDLFHFVKGFPSRDEYLLKANITKSKMALIFAESEVKIRNVFDRDARSMFICTSIERLSPQTYTRVEIMREENIPNFSHINVNDFILSDETISQMMYTTKLNV
jgi:voltage-gated potassium channel